MLNVGNICAFAFGTLLPVARVISDCAVVVG